MVFFWCVLTVLLYTVNSQECTSGFVGDLEGVNPSALTTNTNNNNLMYIYPSLMFTCDGVITGVRMVIPNREDRPQLSNQGVFMIIAVFSDSTVSDVIALKNDDVDRIALTSIIWRTREMHKLNTTVRSGDYIGVAIPRDNITGESIYYQRIAVDSGGSIIQGSTFRLIYNDEIEFEQMVSSATVSNSRGLQRPLIQFTVVPSSVVPSPTTTPTAPPTDTSTGPPPNVGTIIAGAVVGSVVVMTIILLLVMIPVTIVLVKKCKSSSSDNDHTHNYDSPQIQPRYEVPLQRNPAYVTADNCNTMQSSSDYTYI